MVKNITENLQVLENQYKNLQWIKESGLEKSDLESKVFALSESFNGSVIELKAKIFELLAQKSQIAIVPEDIFQAQVNSDDIMRKQRDEFLVKNFYKSREYLPDEIFRKKVASAYAYDPLHDVSHLSSNTELLLNVGINGIIDKIQKAKAEKENLTEENIVFYDSCESVFTSFKLLVNRIADYSKQYAPDCAQSLYNIANGKPQSFYDALHLLIVYFYVHEFLMASRIRTLGRLDKLLEPFYKKDIANGVITKEDAKQMLKYFCLKLSAMDVPFNIPFEVGGGDAFGNEITSELSYLIIDAYGELDIYSPKIHVMVSDKTPKDFILKVLSLIRAGKNSFVFANDEVIVKSLQKVGIAEEDAKNYVLIGCYEPAVYAEEIGCTGNGGVNAVKMLEYVFNRGVDFYTGESLGLDTGVPTTYVEFVDAVKKQIAFAVENSLRIISDLDSSYPKFYADPMLSGMLDSCLSKGKDAYTGSAKYNNSSFYLRFFASLVDSISAVKKVVFDEKLVSFEDLTQILKSNWAGQDKLRRTVLTMAEKYGNNNAVADQISVELSKYFGNLVNGKPNGRGGVFKASNFTIDRYVIFGEHTMASPDGRKHGDPLSKNLCPVTGMDRQGVTALINSVTKLDFTDYPNGAVLDIFLHPSAVSGEDGLEAMYGLLKTFFSKGGQSLHGNVYDAEILIKAKQDPIKYKNLQVRVCGWNSYFVDLTPEEQEDMIKKAQNY